MIGCQYAWSFTIDEVLTFANMICDLPLAQNIY